MAEKKIRPLTEDELLYAVPPDAAKKAEAKVVPFPLSTSNVPATNPVQAPPAAPVAPSAATSSPSFFKKHQTVILVVGGIALIAAGVYFYHLYKKDKGKKAGKKKD